MMAARPSAPPRRRLRARRNALMFGCALGAAAVALADRAQAQAFEGTPGTQAGSVTYNRANPLGPGTETLTINSPGAVILWSPNASGGTVSFLPNGRTARFQGAPGNGNFVVLNRIIPANPTIFQFDGTVISQISATDATRGGTVLFYTPGGIILGSTAVFDVGSLVLTTLDVPFQATGNIIQPDGSIQFRAGRGTGGIQTLAGSQVIANSEGSNVAFVAPALNLAGSVRANGSVGYIAAESVDVAFNNGLFDIVVQTNGGTSAGGTVITHTGSTGGPASTGAGDNHRIYVAGVPQTNAISLLLGGAMGFDNAVSASVENGQIVLSSGYSIDNGAVFEVIDNGAPAATIISTGGSFTSDVTAVARSGIAFSAFSSDLSFTGDLNALSRGAVVGLLAANGFDIGIGGNVFLATTQLVRSLANPDSIGGTAVIQANTGSTITIAGNAALDSSAVGLGLLDGSFVGRGGTVRVTGNGAVSITGNLLMNAIGLGRDGGYGGIATINGANAVTVGGNLGINVGGAASVNAVGAIGGIGQGGSVTLTTTGSILIGGTSTIAAAGIGGDVTSDTVSTGGAGIGGTIDIDTAGGTVALGTLTGMAVFGRGGTALTGGAGTGGAVNVTVRGGAIDLGTNGVLIVGDGTGGAGEDLGGNGTGAAVTMTLISSGTGSALRGGLIAANLDGVGGAANPASGAGGTGRGGTFDLLLDRGDASATLGGITASADGVGGSGLLGSDGFGGRVFIGEDALGLNLGSGGSSSLGNLDLSATGTGGDGPAQGGDGQGGQVRLSAGPVAGGGLSIAFGTALMDASGTGGDGLRPAGNGTGGSVSLNAQGVGASLSGQAVDARANGTGGANPGFIAGGTGQGGTNVGMTASNGGAIALSGTASFSASGTGGASATGIGGAGIGGDTTIEVVDDGAIMITGGTSADLSGTGGDGAAGGTGSGGTFRARVDRTASNATAATVNLGANVNVTANGLGGDGAVAQAGAGTGGSVVIEVESGGTLSLLSAGAVTATVDGIGGTNAVDGGSGVGTGGAGSGGTVRVAVDSGNARATFAGVTASASGTGGGGATLAGAGTGGAIQLVHENRRADGSGGGASFGALDLAATGTGGTGPTGGTGTGGVITLSALDSASGTSIPIDFGTATMTASGIGGDGPVGGTGRGGGISVTTGRSGIVLVGASIDAVAEGIGGNASGAGSNGGAGFGGTLTVTADGGGVLEIAGQAAFATTGRGGNSASGSGGTGSGGLARLLVSGGGAATLGGLTLGSDGVGGNGATGGAGLAGASSPDPLLPLVGGAFLDVVGGTVTAGATTLTARGTGGDGTTGAGGAGVGGSARIVAFGAGSSSNITLASASLDLSGAGGAGSAGGSASGGAGTVRADAYSGVLSIASLAVAADAAGGAGSSLAGGSASGGAIEIGTYVDNASSGALAGSANFGSIIASAGASGGGGATGGGATGGTVRLIADSANVQAGPTALTANAQGGNGGAGGDAGGGTVQLGASGAQLTLTDQTTLAANAVAGSAGGTATGGLLEFSADSDASSGLDGGLVAADVTGTANASGATAGNNVAGQWHLFVAGGDMSFGTLTLDADGDLAATNPASTLFTAAGTINVGGTAELFSVGDIEIGANGGGRYTGDAFAFTSARNISVAHADPVPSTPTFDVNAFSASAGGDFTADAGTVIRASSTLAIAAVGAITVTGQLLGGDITVGGVTVSLALADGDDISLVATSGLDVTQAIATGDVDFLAGGAASFGAVAAGGRFAGSAASLSLQSVTAQDVDVAATAGSALLGTVTGSASLVVTATGAVTFNQLTGGAVALTSGAGGIGGGNLAGASAALTSGGIIDIGTVAATGAVAFQAAGAASFDSVTAGSFAGSATSLDLPDVTATTVNVSATAGAATLGAIRGSSAINVAATGSIDFNQLSGGAITLASSNGNVSGASASGSSAAFNAAGSVNVASATATGNIVFQAGGNASFGSATAGGSFTGSAASLSLPQVTAATVSVGATAGTATLGAVTGTTSLNVTASDDVTFAQLTGGTIALTSTGGDIFGANASGTTLTFDAAQIAGFSGLIAGSEIRVTSRDIDLGSAARLGNSGTQLVSLTARPSGQQTVIGGSAQGPGYTLTNAEAGRIRTAQLAILASANGNAANRAPDVLLRDLSLSATPTSSGAGVNQLSVTVGGSAPGILQVEGAVRLANAGTADGISITAPGRLQVVTDTGSIRVLDAGGLPSGEITLASNNLWSANSALLGQLLVDPNFAGRNDALLTNGGPVNERGYIEAGEVTLRVGSTLFVQNSGTRSAFAGITVIRDTLTVIPTGTSPLSAFAFGRRINPDGSFRTNSLYFYEVAFNRQGAGYTNDAQFNLCFINSGICPGLFGDLDIPDGREPIEGPIGEADDADGGGAIPAGRTVNDDIIDTGFGTETLIEEPVTSGSDSSLWDCERDDRGRCLLPDGEE